GPVPVDHACRGPGLAPGLTIGSKILLRKSPRPACLGKRIRHRPKISGLEQKFWQPWKLHEKNVPAAQNLGRMRARIFPDHAWMRRIQYRQPPHTLLMSHGASPGNDSAPIMARKHKMLAPQSVSDAKDIVDEMRNRVGPPILRLAALVVAAL